MNVVIPSYKRAGQVKGVDYFNAKIIIPTSQRSEYLQYYKKNQLIIISDQNDGNIARKRNWILNNIERPLLMIDDDVSGLVHSQGQYSEDGKFIRTIQNIKLSRDESLKIIEAGFNLANEWGCRIWGININHDGRNYKQFAPFALSHVVLGPFMGHLDHNLQYDERMGTKDDYDMSLQCLQRYGKILRFNKYAYNCKHGTNEGGIVSMRTMEKEIEYCTAIMKKWGRSIIKYTIPPRKMGDLLNGQVNIPIAGV